MDANPDRDAKAVLTRLRQIIRAVDVQSKKLAREAGLSSPQLIVLQAIDELGEVTTRSVSQSVSLSQPTVTAILDRLEGRGLIERYRSETDRRVVHSRLTASGRNQLRAAPPLLQETFIAAFSDLSEERRTEIISALIDIAQMMGADDIDASPVLTVGAPSSGH
ncbi:MAG: MarR family winged helix-turn-helix transcriptional regulator [Pseudomonadota bacterium]